MADQMPNNYSFCWNELLTRDTGKSKDFLTKLLGWSGEDQDMGGTTYTVFKNKEGNMVAGMMHMPPNVPAEAPPHWLGYVSVEDVDAAAKKVAELGGRVLHEPTDIPTVGRFSVISDPTGAVFGIITLKS